MSYGISNFNINENFSTLSLQRNGYVTFSQGKATIDVFPNEIIVIGQSDGQVFLVERSETNAVVESNGFYTSYWIFGPNTPKTTGYGIEVYDTSGNVTFSSNHKFLKPITNIDTSISKGTFNFTGDASKKYGVVLSNFGFDYTLYYDTTKYVARSIKPSNNTITFGTLTKTYSSLNKINSNFIGNRYFNALIVDITGY